MKNFLSQQAFTWSLLLNVALYIVAYLCFIPQYGTIDDVEMQLVASGKSLAEVPSPNLRWTSIFAGYLLSELYSAYPDYHWYAWYLYAAHFLGTTAVLYVLFKMQLSWLRGWVAVLLLVGFQFPILQELQFTSAAATLCAGGCLLLFLSFYRSDSRLSPVWYAVGFIMVCLSAVVRWHAMCMVVMLMSVLWFYAVVRGGGRWWLRLLLLALPVGGGASLQYAHLQVQAQHEGWRDFEQRMANGFGHDIMDYHHKRYQWDSITMPVYWSNGWSYNDYQLFTNWFMADSVLYGTSKQAAIKKRFDETSPKYDIDQIENRLRAFPSVFSGYLYAAFLFGFCALMLVAANRAIYSVVVMTMLGACAVCALLFVLYHLPPRVSYSIGFAMVAVLALWVGYQAQLSRVTQWGAVLLTLFLVILPALKSTWQRSEEAEFQFLRHAHAFKQLNPQPDQIFAMSPWLFQQHLVLPLGIKGDTAIHIENFKALDFGNLSICPTYYEQLDALGVNNNIHSHLVDNPKGFLIYRYNHPRWDWYLQYQNEHLLDTMRYKNYMDFPDLGISIKQMTRDTVPLPN